MIFSGIRRLIVQPAGLSLHGVLQRATNLNISSRKVLLLSSIDLVSTQRQFSFTRFVLNDVEKSRLTLVVVG